MPGNRKNKKRQNSNRKNVPSRGKKSTPVDNSSEYLPQNSNCDGERGIADKRQNSSRRNVCSRCKKLIPLDNSSENLPQNSNCDSERGNTPIGDKPHRKPAKGYSLSLQQEVHEYYDPPTRKPNLKPKKIYAVQKKVGKIYSTDENNRPTVLRQEVRDTYVTHGPKQRARRLKHSNVSRSPAIIRRRTSDRTYDPIQSDNHLLASRKRRRPRIPGPKSTTHLQYGKRCRACRQSPQANQLSTHSRPNNTLLRRLDHSEERPIFYTDEWTTLKRLESDISSTLSEDSCWI